MNLLDICETEVEPSVYCMVHSVIDGLDGKPFVFEKGKNHTIESARLMAIARSSVLLTTRYAVYNEHGHLDSVYLNMERIVSRCD